MGKEQKKEVVAPQAQMTAVALNDMYAADGGSGFENVNASTDAAIPFIGILQSLSPQVKRGSASQILGAQEGDFYNNVTREVIKGVITVVPCAFKKVWVEWVPRESGGGFVQQHPDDSLLKTCSIDEKRNRVLPNGNHLVETAYHFVLVKRVDGRLERAVISMTKTQLKHSRRWMTQMMEIQLRLPNGRVIQPPPMYSHEYDFATFLEEKHQNSWYSFKLTGLRIITEAEVYVRAKKFHAEVTSGSVDVKPTDDVGDVDQTTSPDTPF